MGFLSGVADVILVLFSAVLAVAVPLIDAQTCLPGWLFPPYLAEVKRGYGEEYGDYLMVEKPHFFMGLVWVEIAFLWPLALANVYGIIAKKSWVGTTCLMAGVSTATSMTAIMAELLGSGRASTKLLQMYVPFVAFALIAILRGLCSCSSRATSSASNATARKKRA